MNDDMSMKKIADLAGVSPATVSRVFRSPHLVTKKTRDRVMRSVKSSGYIYNSAASEFSSKRSSVLGVLIPTPNFIFGQTLTAIQDVAINRGYSTLQGVTNYDLEVERKYLRQFQERRVAGIIMAGLIKGQEELVEEIVKSEIPLVIAWERIDNPDVSYVGFDNRLGARTATEYLISLGHRRIGILAGPYSKVPRVNKRLQGFLEIMEEHGLDVDDSLVLERWPRFLEGTEAMNRLLSLPKPPTAVFAASDSLALGAMHAVQQRGLSVPDDMSIIGFDDADPSAFLNPPLTTIRVEASKMGALATETVIGMAEREIVEPRQYILNTDLVVRKSCAIFREKV